MLTAYRNLGNRILESILPRTSASAACNPDGFSYSYSDASGNHELWCWYDHDCNTRCRPVV